MNTAAPAKPRVLLADDHAPFLESIRRLLAPAFDVVAVAGDGRGALDLARRLQPDVAVLDASMPGLNGFETLEQLRQDGTATTVVFLTMHRDDEYVAAAINGGARGYVLKTRLHLDLVAAIDHALAGRLFVPSLTSLSAVAGPRHTVQFHGNDSHYLDEVSELVAATLRSGEQVVLVAREATLDGVAQRLQARQMNLDTLAERKLYVAQDSGPALSQVMRRGRPDKERLAEIIGGLEQLRAAGPNGPRGRLTVFGDVSVSLCRNGGFEAALEVERLWNELTRALPILTVCSYPIECFEHPDAGNAFQDVCAEHSAVTCGFRAAPHRPEAAI